MINKINGISGMYKTNSINKSNNRGNKSDVTFGEGVLGPNLAKIINKHRDIFDTPEFSRGLEAFRARKGNVVLEAWDTASLAFEALKDRLSQNMVGVTINKVVSRNRARVGIQTPEIDSSVLREVVDNPEYLSSMHAPFYLIKEGDREAMTEPLLRWIHDLITNPRGIDNAIADKNRELKYLVRQHTEKGTKMVLIG